MSTDLNPSAVLADLMGRFRDREALGLKKYGTTLDRKDLTPADLRKHLLEELMDACMYLVAEQRAATDLSSPQVNGQASYADDPTFPSDDRSMLLLLNREFDTTASVCACCGREEDARTMDAASMLRDYLAAYPAAREAAHPTPEYETGFRDGFMSAGGDFPEGYVLAPVEPTEAMLGSCSTIIQGYSAKLVWARMLAARQAGGA